MLAAMLACRFGGLKAGLAVMLGGELLGDYLLPTSTIGPMNRLDWAYLVFYFAATGLALWFIESLRRTGFRAERTTLLAASRGELLRTGMNELQKAETRIRELAAIIENSRAADVAERERAEQQLQQSEALVEKRVRERTAALEAANRELEAFSYSVSHDLRAPLRSINGFTKSVLEEYQGQLDERALTYLQHVYDSSQRMSDLIANLLTLSRVSAGELQQEMVNLSEVASAIVGELQKSESHRVVNIRVAPQLTVWADRGLVTIALQNLLHNAWKFTANTPQARIELTSELRDHKAVVLVSDNGVGFNPADAVHLFKVFKRLHPAKLYPGTGIGLATVKRIVQRHGGDIGAEGAPNAGATFYFTLPLPCED